MAGTAKSNQPWRTCHCGFTTFTPGSHTDTRCTHLCVRIGTWPTLLSLAYADATRCQLVLPQLGRTPAPGALAGGLPCCSISLPWCCCFRLAAAPGPQPLHSRAARLVSSWWLLASRGPAAAAAALAAAPPAGATAATPAAARIPCGTPSSNQCPLVSLLTTSHRNTLQQHWCGMPTSAWCSAVSCSCPFTVAVPTCDACAD